MGQKPEKGSKVVVKATKEAVFGEDEVKIKKITVPEGKKVTGLLTGNVIAGYCEVENTSLDGEKHWFPIEQLYTLEGEQLEEENVPLDISEDSS